MSARITRSEPRKNVTVASMFERIGSSLSATPRPPYHNVNIKTTRTFYGILCLTHEHFSTSSAVRAYDRCEFNDSRHSRRDVMAAFATPPSIGDLQRHPMRRSTTSLTTVLLETPDAPADDAPAIGRTRNG